jgi:hypothetical protein
MPGCDRPLLGGRERGNQRSQQPIAVAQLQVELHLLSTSSGVKRSPVIYSPFFHLHIHVCYSCLLPFRPGQIGQKDHEGETTNSKSLVPHGGTIISQGVQDVENNKLEQNKNKNKNKNITVAHAPKGEQQRTTRCDHNPNPAVLGHDAGQETCDHLTSRGCAWQAQNPNAWFASVVSSPANEVI